jgi:hypothetical protein
MKGYLIKSKKRSSFFAVGGKCFKATIDKACRQGVGLAFVTYPLQIVRIPTLTDDKATSNG